MPTLLALAALSAQAAGPLDRLPCHTMDLLDGAFLAAELVGDRPPPPPDGKSTRDAYGVPNSLESDNFIIRWGGGVDTSDAQDMLDAFERSWQVELVDMDHPQPQGSDTHKFNVYVGGTGGGTPDDYGAAGYFNTDSAGWPMIVLNANTVEDTDYGVTTVAHEFYHAVQYATGTYQYEDEGAWFWEATASWIEVEVYPDNPGYVAFLFGYALLPHLELNFFDYPDTGALREYHQYGAFIFPRYLAEFVGDWRIVRNAWVQPQVSGNDPLAALVAEMDDLGVGMDEAFMDFAARNVTWDYEHGDWYEYYVDAYAEYYPSQDHRRVEAFRGAGTDGAFSPPSSLAPRRFGVNVVELDDPDAGDLRIIFEGDSAGSDGSTADFGLTLVRVGGNQVDYEPLLLGGTELDTWVQDVGGDDALYLVIGAWSDRLRWDETFSYSVSLEIDGDDGGGEDGGGGDGGGEDGGGGDGVGDDTGSDDLSLGSSKGTEFPFEGCATRSGHPLGGLALVAAALACLGVRRDD